MTLDQLLSSLITLLTRSGDNRVSPSDMLTACQNIVNYFASQLASIIPDWADNITFNTDGTGAGRYCKYPDSAGKKRIYETLIDDNINHAPPSNGGDNTYWSEISQSASAAIPEWQSGVYGPGLVIVFHNHSTDGRGLYVLLDPIRPFSSTNIESEIAAGKWQLMGGSGVSTFAELEGSAADNSSLVSYVTAQLVTLIDSSPATLDTLNELAAALGDDPNFATTITALIGAKVAKTGDTMSGNLAMGGNKVTGLGAASVNGDAVRFEQLPPKVIQLACSDEVTSLTTGVAKITFRMPFAMTLLAVRASLTIAQSSGSILTVDINKSGSTILSTKLTIDNTEKTSITAATPPVISDASLGDDAELTIDIDQLGSGTATGLKITLVGT